MVEKPAYLFLGEDYLSKERKVDLIKTELFKAGAEAFDLEILYGKDLSSVKLSEALKKLPALSRKRLIIIKDIDRLHPSARDLLLAHLKKPSAKIELVFETDKYEARDAFMAQLSRWCRVFNFRKAGAPLDVFGLAEMVARRRPVEALRILSRLLFAGEKPHKILGVLIWQWKKLEAGLPKDEFRQGLKMLLETDLNIKRGRMKPDFALELLVAKLSLPVSRVSV
jgi:DNA polymerase III delta subunit